MNNEVSVKVGTFFFRPALQAPFFPCGTIPVAFSVMLVFWITVAWSQTRPNSAEQQNTQQQTSENRAGESSLSHDQDQQFLALVHARDRQLAAITELRRILDYHTGFRDRLSQVLDFGDRFPRIQTDIISSIDTEIARLDKFEQDYKNAKDDNEKDKIAQSFDENYPLFRAGTCAEGIEGCSDSDLFSDVSNFRLPGRSLGRISDSTYIRICAFIQTERKTSTEVFQNSSSDIKVMMTRYTSLFRKLEQYTLSIGRGPKVPALDRLPRKFDGIAANSTSLGWTTLTPGQIQAGIDKYREALSKEKAKHLIQIRWVIPIQLPLKERILVLKLSQSVLI